LRSKNKGTKCTFVVSEPQHQLWVQWGMWRPRRGHALISLILIVPFSLQKFTKILRVQVITNFF
jgi:hypothetical protein